MSKCIPWVGSIECKTDVGDFGGLFERGSIGKARI